VVDTTPPVIGAPGSDMVLECPEKPVFTPPSATDNCDPNPVVVLVETPPSPPNVCGYTESRSWRAVDACGNLSKIVTQTITVLDTTAPSISCPPDVTVECPGDTSPASTGSATATDACSAVTVTYTDSFEPACGNTGVITRTWTATDVCGNSSSCDQIITVVDTTPPVFEYCPSDYTRECSSPQAEAPVLAFDNCDGEVPVTMTVESIPGDCPQAGKVVRTWTATDACGNSSTCSQTITTVDTTPPIVAWPGDVNLTCAECDIDPANTGEPEATDNCGDISISYTDVITGDCPKYIERNWVVSDGCNEVTHTQIIQCLPTFKVVVTDSSLCTYDMDPSTECKDFRLLFTQDPQNWPSFKVTATNPGQTFINLQYNGAVGQEVTFSITLPYPYVTQGAMPVHAYDWVQMVPKGDGTDNYCIIPGEEIFVDGTQVTLDDYVPQAMGSTYSFDVTVTVPDTGFIYLNVHLDYGLKGTGGYMNNATDDAVDAATLSTILIPNHDTYPFSSSVNGESADDSLCNINVFKKLPGGGGFIGKPFTTLGGETALIPATGCTVKMIAPDGTVVATGESDEDGWYMCLYKHTGKPTVYTFEMTTPTGDTQSKSEQLKANKYVEINFDLP